MMRTSVLVVLLSALSCLASASPLPDFPFVYVQGTAEKSIEPDKAMVRFQVVSYDTNASEAYQQQADSADKALAFTKELGIPAEAITANAIEKRTVRKQDEYGNDLEIIGYEAKRSVHIEVSDLSLFSKLIEFLYGEQRIERISVDFGRKDETTILRSLTEDACTNARESAERLSSGFQRKLKEVRAISESGFSGLGDAFGVSQGALYGRNSFELEEKGRDFRVIPSTISFRKTVFAIFEIK